MAISLSSITKTASKPWRTIIYGTHGIGKSTFAAQAESPIFIQTEDGLSGLQCDAFPLAKTFEEVMDAIGVLYKEDHKFKTLVVDSIDWLEPLVWSFTAQEHGKSSIEDFGFGKGFVFASDTWRKFIGGLNALRDDKGMEVILLAHTEVKRYDNPETEPYDRHQIKLHKRAAELMQEWADVVGFANYKTMVTKDDVGMNAKKVRAIGSGERVLYTSERPAFYAKNRFNLPHELQFTYKALKGEK